MSNPSSIAAPIFGENEDTTNSGGNDDGHKAFRNSFLSIPSSLAEPIVSETIMSANIDGRASEGASDIDKLIVELNIEEEERRASLCRAHDDPNDNDFQKILVHRLESARKVLTTCHTQVLNLVAQRIQANKHADEFIESLRNEKENLRNDTSSVQREALVQSEASEQNGLPTTIDEAQSSKPEDMVTTKSAEEVVSPTSPQVLPPDPPIRYENWDTSKSNGADSTKTDAVGELPPTVPMLGSVTTEEYYSQATSSRIFEVGDAKSLSINQRKQATVLPAKRSSQVSTGTAGVVMSHQMSEALRPIGSRRIFSLLPVWEKKTTHFKAEINPVLKHNESVEIMARLSVTSGGEVEWNDPDDAEAQKRGSGGRIVVNPNSPYRVTWDLISLLLVVFDMFFIPLQLFEPPETAFESITSWIARLFWSCDIPMSFCTGFIRKDGAIVMSPLLIAKRYTSTWFILDFLIVSVDWFEVLGSGDGSLGLLRVGKASRVFRIIRMVRLLRLLRIRDVLKVLSERIQSESLLVVLSIAQITCIILGMAHLMACIWWSIGQADDKNWYTSEGLDTRSFGYRYFTSLHWSLSQFTGGMDEVRPTNLGERLYAVIAFMLCFVVAAVILSSLTSSLTRLHIISSGNSKKFSTLRKYLYQNGISSKLALRIQRNATHTLIEQERSMPEKEVELLTLVNEPLRIDLHSEIFSPLLSTHPFFDQYSTTCPQVLRKVCHVATSISLVSCGDIIFEAGENPRDPKMYIISDGELRYTSFQGQTTQVHNGHWLSEAALWVAWMHRGVLVAKSECCRLVVLDSKKFQEIVGQFEHHDFDPRRYAQSFVKDLNHLTSASSEVTDLPFEFAMEEGKSHAASLLKQTSIKNTRSTRVLASRRILPTALAKAAAPKVNSVVPSSS